MKIIGIVALYNPQKEDLDNIKGYIGKLDECILMDDSGKNNKDVVCKHLISQNTNYIYQCNEENIGLAASINRGIRIALQKGADWILLMDQDSRFENNLLQEYKNYLQQIDDEKVCACVPQYTYDRHIRSMYNGVKKVKWSNMSGMLISRQAFQEIGLFEEKLFIDGIDVEWCVRARKLGYYIVEIGMALLKHHPATTKEIVIGNKVFFKYGWAPPERYYYQFRSYYYIIKKYKDWESCKWMFIKLLKSILLFDNRNEYFIVFCKAIGDAKNNRWGKVVI